MLKRFYVVFLLAATLLPQNILASCDYMPYFNLQSNELVLPCINIGGNGCISATLSLSVEGEYVYFYIKDVSQVNQAIPSGDESILIPVFDGGDSVLEIPYLKVGEGVFEVILKVSSVNIGGVTTNFLELQSAVEVMMPSICNDNLLSCWTTTDDGGVFACYEFSGSITFVEQMLNGCSEMSGHAYAPCPEGAIYSCSYDFPENNKITLYSYSPHAALPCEGLGNMLPISF